MSSPAICQNCALNEQYPACREYYLRHVCGVEYCRAFRKRQSAATQQIMQGLENFVYTLRLDVQRRLNKNKPSNP